MAHAATLPEPALRLSPAIESPGVSVGFPAEERQLLRVEYRAAQTRGSEADMVGNIVASVRRMDGTVHEIRQLIEAWPGPEGAMPQGALRKAPIETPAATAPQPSGDTEAGSDVAMRALMAAVILFLFWLLGKRHAYLKSQRKKAGGPGTPVVSQPEEVPASTAVAAAPIPVPEPPSVAPVIVETAPLVPPPPAVASVPPAASRPAPPPSPPATAAALAPLEFESIHDFGQSPPAEILLSQTEAAEFASSTDQSLELAEIMLSMGLAHGAAQTLTDRIRENPKRALYHWLKLLEVYRRSDMQEDFEHAANELRQAFNVQPEGWKQTGGDGRSIEDYAHLAERLQTLWPTPECQAFLASLLEDNRGGTRHGFPQSVAEEILLLEKIISALNAPEN